MRADSSPPWYGILKDKSGSRVGSFLVRLEALIKT